MKLKYTTTTQVNIERLKWIRLLFKLNKYQELGQDAYGVCQAVVMSSTPTQTFQIDRAEEKI